MTPLKGYYSVVQYCPDLGRFEAANVGVLLFCPEAGFLRALTSRNNRRIIRFFGTEGHDWKRINAFKRGLEDRLLKEGGEIQTLDGLKQFIATRANVMQITAPMPMPVLNPQRELCELFEQIIGEPAKKGRPAGFRKQIERALLAPELKQRVERQVKVNVPVLEKEIEVPFGFQNGRYNLISPVRFTAKSPEQSVNTACKYAVEGRSLYEHRDPKRGQLQLIVVGHFRPKDQKTPQRVRRVFDDYDVKLFRTDELPKLVEEIRLTAKPIPRTRTQSNS